MKLDAFAFNHATEIRHHRSGHNATQQKMSQNIICKYQTLRKISQIQIHKNSLHESPTTEARGRANITTEKKTLNSAIVWIYTMHMVRSHEAIMFLIFQISGKWTHKTTFTFSDSCDLKHRYTYMTHPVSRHPRHYHALIYIHMMINYTEKWAELAEKRRAHGSSGRFLKYGGKLQSAFGSEFENVHVESIFSHFGEHAHHQTVKMSIPGMLELVEIIRKSSYSACLKPQISIRVQPTADTQNGSNGRTLPLRFNVRITVRTYKWNNDLQKCYSSTVYWI